MFDASAAVRESGCGFSHPIVGAVLALIWGNILFVAGLPFLILICQYRSIYGRG